MYTWDAAVDKANFIMHELDFPGHVKGVKHKCQEI
jgi:hypothetical protein